MVLWIVIALVGLVVVAGLVLALGGGGGGLPSQFPPGTLAFEAELTETVLVNIIAARKAEQAGAGPDEAAELGEEIAFLTAQLEEIRAVVARGDTSPGRGYIGFDAFGATESSWAKASQMG